MTSTNPVFILTRLFVVLIFCCLLPLHLSANTGEIITVDNLDDLASAQGYWATSGGQAPHGSNSIYSLNSTFLWEADLPTEGEYIVEAYWTKWSNRSEQANYEITHANGSDNVSVNQRTTGAEWVELGRYQFTAGRYGVTISNNDPNNTTLNADAIRFIQVVDSKPDGIIEVDNLDANVIREGNWSTSAGLNPYKGNSEFSRNPPGYTPQARFTWLPQIMQAGRYEVQVYWTSYPNRAEEAYYAIEHSGKFNSVATVNQKIDSSQWVSLGVYHFNAGDGAISLVSESANATISADTIRLIPASEKATNTSTNTVGDEVRLASSGGGGYINGRYHAGIGTSLEYNNLRKNIWSEIYESCGDQCPIGSNYGELTQVNDKGYVVSVAHFVRDGDRGNPIRYGRSLRGWLRVTAPIDGELINLFEEDYVFFNETQYTDIDSYEYYTTGPTLLEDVNINENNHFHVKYRQPIESDIYGSSKEFYIQNYWLNDSLLPNDDGYVIKAQRIKVE